MNNSWGLPIRLLVAAFSLSVLAACGAQTVDSLEINLKDQRPEQIIILDPETTGSVPKAASVNYYLDAGAIHKNFGSKQSQSSSFVPVSYTHLTLPTKA